MEAKAVHRYIGSSPRKMRLLIDLIRGMNVEKAIEVLHFHTKHASEEGERVEPSQLYVKEAFVNQGPTLKRISPAPMGRAYRIRKRSCHLTIVVASQV
ncbi:MAG: 50S ribosomal protein L22 [Ignavibacteriaceae bacterium]